MNKLQMDNETAELMNLYSEYYSQMRYKKAVEHLTKAAQRGYVIAQHNLAVSYQRGEGVEKNIKKALKWYKKAAKQGYEPSKEALKSTKSGTSYLAGIVSFAFSALPIAIGIRQMGDAWFVLPLTLIIATLLILNGIRAFQGKGHIRFFGL